MDLSSPYIVTRLVILLSCEIIFWRPNQLIKMCVILTVLGIVLKNY